MSTLALAVLAQTNRRLFYAPVWLWIAFALTSVVFVVFPQIDLSVSHYFFTPGVGFAAKGTKPEQLISGSVAVLLVVGNLALILSLLFPRFTGRLKTRLKSKQLVYLLILLALGPGLIVNAVLKEHWGRPRPVKVEQFGGSNRFSPAFVPTRQQGKSFSSGHAAASAYWIFVALLLAPGRIWALRVAVLYSLAVSWMRLAAGAHFLSDIVTSYFIMAILGLALYEIVFVNDTFAVSVSRKWVHQWRRLAVLVNSHFLRLPMRCDSDGHEGNVAIAGPLAFKPRASSTAATLRTRPTQQGNSKVSSTPRSEAA